MGGEGAPRTPEEELRSCREQLAALREAKERSEASLRESEGRYRLLVENAGDGIFIALDAQVVFANRRAAEMAGYDRPEEVCGRSILDFIHPEDHALVADRHARRVRGESVPPTYALRMRRADGSPFWTNLNAVVVEWQGRPATLNFIRDMTDQRRLEEQLAAAERLRSLGTLAGGIAHDFNNILMGIQGNVSLLLQGLDPGNPLRSRLEEIEHCVESGAEVTARILGFAQGGRYQPAPTDLNALARASLEMFARAHRQLEVRTCFAAEPATAEVDRAQIEQVLLNLFVNAWQAMPGGGVLTVRTENVRLDDEAATAAGVAPGDCLRVTVADTGAGIDPAIRDRIFEPFFTTKDRGRGTGLGLASAYGIMRRHGGAIVVDTALEGGASLSLLLPLSGKPAAAGAPRAAGAAAPCPERGAGTVLLVDDEPVIRSVCKEILEQLGITVLLAGSGEEALEIFREHRVRIDAVVLDMVMPGMSGSRTFDRLRELDPGVAVLLASGYSLDSEAGEILARGCDGFIQKPFRPAELSAKLARVLQHPARGAPPGASP